MENNTVYLIIEGQRPYMNNDFIKEIEKILRRENQSYQTIKEYEYTDYLGEEDIYTLVNYGINKWIKKFNNRRNVKYTILNTSILTSKIIMDLEENKDYVTREQYEFIIERIRKYKEILKPRKVIYVEYSGLERNKEYEQKIKATYGEYTKIKDIRREYIDEGLEICYELRKETDKQNTRYIIGLLCTEEGEVYLTKEIGRRNSHWKNYQAIEGKVEYEEIPEQTCVRKVREETGVKIDERQIKYVGQHKNNEEKRIYDLYMIEIGGIQVARMVRSIRWSKMTGQQMYKRKLTPVLERFKKEILKELGYKYKD